MPRKTVDLTNEKFGMLTVIRFDGYRSRGNATNVIAYWLCKCDCGNTKSIPAADLKNKKSVSCGCKRKHSRQMIDMTGKKYNKITVLEMLPEPNHKTKCKCLCDCGNIFTTTSYDVRSGHTKSCGCIPSSSPTELIGKKFNMLTPYMFGGITNKKTRWWCKCDCGNIVLVYATNLVNGHSKSCGCLHLKSLGLSKSRIYSIYTGMVNRCYNPNSKEYKNYGGRGISVCEKWLGENGSYLFYLWATRHGYKENLSIDRIDNNKGYSPDNCRWATLIEQANNKRNNIKLTYNGETKTVKEWSRIVGLKYPTLMNRVKSGWCPEKALFSPLKKGS